MTGNHGGTMPIPDDAEEFAALLRRLKDRTGRSYGSLARRVDMNTSTLYRYCAGAAVPQDFAPVERLATFCGATAQERLDLHRLWLSAVAARQRVRTVDAPAEATPAPAPDEHSHSSSASPHLWYRRPRRLVSTAVATAVALLATAGTSVLLSDDRSSQVDTSHPTSPRTTAAGAPGRSSEPSDPSDTDTDTDAYTKPAADLPLTWSVDPLVWDKGCDHDYVIGEPPAEVPPPPLEQDAGVWAATQDAVNGRRTKVRISVQGRSSTAVILEALRVRVVSRGTPVPGNAYAMGQGCGSDLTPRSFTVNLDVNRPVAQPEDGTDAGADAGADGQRTIPAVHFPYRVSAEDPEVLLVDATTQTYDARWYLELEWSSQGRTGTIRIDDDGRPFHTTGIEGMPHYWYGTNDAEERAWVPLDSH